MKKMKKRFFVLLYCMAFVAVVGIAQFTSNSITAMVENKPIIPGVVYVIDPGHGGIDGGATSCTGVLESHINLQIGLKLKDLMHLLGYQTVMTRTTDTSIHTEGQTIASQKVSDLKNRVQIVNETDKAVLVSIHQNTYPDSRYSGAQVFCNASGKALAQSVQTALNPNRICKTATGVYLMEHINKPGILIECGFISNPEDAVKMTDNAYQNQLCASIATVLATYNANT